MEKGRDANFIFLRDLHTRASYDKISSVYIIACRARPRKNIEAVPTPWSLRFSRARLILEIVISPISGDTPPRVIRSVDSETRSPAPPPSDLHPNISEFKAHRVHLSALTARTARRSVNKRTKPNSSKRWLHYFMNGTGLALPRPVTSIPPRDFSRPREKKRAFGPRDRDHAHANGERRPFRFVSEQRTT